LYHCFSITTLVLYNDSVPFLATPVMDAKTIIWIFADYRSIGQTLVIMPERVVWLCPTCCQITFDL